MFTLKIRAEHKIAVVDKPIFVLVAEYGVWGNVPVGMFVLVQHFDGVADFIDNEPNLTLLESSAVLVLSGDLYFLILDVDPFTERLLVF
jgi:hypothetical protein